MNKQQRKELNVDEYSESTWVDEHGYRFEATAKSNGAEYCVSSDQEGEEDLVRDTLVGLLVKANAAAKIN